MSRTDVHVIGGGLAGCEAALQLARLGVPCTLHEMRPVRTTPAHRTAGLAEIVCSNSLKSTEPATASGLLKAELDLAGCRLLAAARDAAVPAGAALAVDRERFSAAVAALIAAEPLVTLVRDEVTDFTDDPAARWIVATGPLTSPDLNDAIARRTGGAGLHFFDAVAPSVSLESLDCERLFRAARYDKGEADYWNAPMDRDEYHAFCAELVAAERAEVHDFEKSLLFDGCQPVEEIADSGPETLAHGPLRPVGLRDPRTGQRAYAVVQLRQENAAGTIFGLVGFQTRLKQGEQRRVLRMIPGLANAEFVRYGQLHRNLYLDAPRVLDPRFALRDDARIRFAGQITGVEGYVESIASGLTAAWRLAAELRQIELPDWPGESLLGALLDGFLRDATSRRFSPMNANFGLLPPAVEAARGRRGRQERKEALAARALAALRTYLSGDAAVALLTP